MKSLLGVFLWLAFFFHNLQCREIGLHLEDLLDCFKNSEYSKGLEARRKTAIEAIAGAREGLPWEISWSREKNPGFGREDFSVLSKEFRLPWLRRNLKGLMSVEAREHDLQLQREYLARLYEIQSMFYETRFIEGNAKLHQKYRRRLSSLLKKHRQRVMGGEGLAVDALRIEQEHNLETLREASSWSAHAASKKKLIRLAHYYLPEGSGSSDFNLLGELLPVWKTANFEKAVLAIGENLELAAILLKIEKLTLKARNQAKSKIRTVRLEAGQKRVLDVGVNDRANLFEVSTQLPFQDPYGSQRKASKARLKVETLRLKERQKILQSHLKIHSDKLEMLIAQHSMVKPRIQKANQRILSLAEQTFFGGEGTLTDLLDSYRGQFEANLELLELAFNARKEWILFHRKLQGLEE